MPRRSEPAGPGRRALRRLDRQFSLKCALAVAFRANSGRDAIKHPKSTFEHRALQIATLQVPGTRRSKGRATVQDQPIVEREEIPRVEAQLQAVAWIAQLLPAALVGSVEGFNFLRRQDQAIPDLVVEPHAVEGAFRGKLAYRGLGADVDLGF